VKWEIIYTSLFTMCALSSQCYQDRLPDDIVTATSLNIFFRINLIASCG